MACTMPRKAKPKKGIGKKLAKLREDSGLTQEQAAEKIGVVRETWGAWEVGTKKPSQTCLKLISLIFKIKL